MNSLLQFILSHHLGPDFGLSLFNLFSLLLFLFQAHYLKFSYYFELVHFSNHDFKIDIDSCHLDHIDLINLGNYHVIKYLHFVNDHIDPFIYCFLGINLYFCLNYHD